MGLRSVILNPAECQSPRGVRVSRARAPPLEVLAPPPEMLAPPLARRCRPRPPGTERAAWLGTCALEAAQHVRQILVYQPQKQTVGDECFAGIYLSNI